MNILSIICTFFIFLGLSSCTKKTTLLESENKAYQAILPCDDCHGVHHLLVLGEDNSFRLERKYLGASETVDVDTGRFQFSNEDQHLTIPLQKEEQLVLVLGEDHLFVLDQNKQKMKQKNNEYLLFKPINLVNATFWLQELEGLDKNTPHMDKVWLAFEGNSLIGHTSCNTLRGSWEQTKKDQLISLSNMATTKKFCPDSQIETHLLETLENVAKYVIVNETLYLTDLHNKALLTLKAGPPR